MIEKDNLPMTGMILDALCLTLSLVFFWSTLLVLVGLFRKTRPFPKAERRLRFAILPISGLLFQRCQDIFYTPITSFFL